jgi:hypothetical protein
MRGQPVRLLLPMKGLIKNQTPDLIPPDGLIDGQNVFMDLDALMKPRFGYAPESSSTPSIGPVIGLWWWVDLNGTNQYLAVGLSGAAAKGSGVWHQVTGMPLQGSVNDPIVFANFFQNDTINVLFTNNHDVIQVWNTAQTTVQDLTPTIALAGTNNYTGTTAPSFVNWPISTQFFFTVPSASTSSVTLNLNGAGAQPLRYLNLGVVTELPVGYLQPGITYNASFDGTQLLIGTNLQAPACRSMAVVAGRVVAINIINGGVRSFTQVTWTSTFDMTQWPALAFYNLVDFDDPLVAIAPLGNYAAIIYGRNSAFLMQAVGGVTDPFAFQFTPIRGVVTGPVGAQAICVAEGYQYYFGVDGRIWLCDGSEAMPLSSQIDPLLQSDFNPALQSQTLAFYFPRYRHVWFFYAANDNSAGPRKAVLYNLERQVFEPLQVFQETIRSIVAESASIGTTWNDLTRAWSTYNQAWNTFPALDSTGVFIGMDSGAVMLFGPGATNDNGKEIPYFFVPGLISAGPGADLRLDSIDVYFRPSSTFEMTTIEIDTQNTPYGALTPVTAVPFDLSDERTFGFPKSLPTLTAYSRYLRFLVTGVSFHRALAYGGGVVFVDQQQRPSAPSK